MTLTQQKQPLIITGTDTDAGKTWATLALMRYLQQQGLQVVGMKPIASGCDKTEMGLRNADALCLQQYSSVACDYDLINPYAFVPPVSPNFASAQVNQVIDLAVIKTCYQQLQSQADQVLIEGIGGWAVPFNEQQQSLQDLALQLDAGVVLVVGLRLGCINHALLSVAAILNAKVRFVGWIANQVDADFASQDTLNYLQQRISVPYLGYVPNKSALSPENLQQMTQNIHWL